MLSRPLVLAGGLLLALVLAAPALGARVHVRVEGASTTIFGASEPRVAPVRGTFTPPAGPAVTVEADTPLGALERASRLGEFYYRLEAFSFGPYVAQIGRRAGTGTTGWVFKVNGASPPVGAHAYRLREGDRVLWYHATFGPSGGPKTLELRYVTNESRRPLFCFVAELVDDNGRATPATRAVLRRDGRRIRSVNGRACFRGHWHTMRATARTAVRSRIVVAPRRLQRGAAPALAGRLR